MKLLRSYIFFTIVIFSINISHGQEMNDIKQSLNNAPNDTIKLKLLSQLAGIYLFIKPDSCIFYAQQAADLAHELHLSYVESISLNLLGEGFRFTGDFSNALDAQLKALNVNRSTGHKSGEAVSLTFIGALYSEMNEFRQGINYMSLASKMYGNLSVSDVNAYNLNFPESAKVTISAQSLFNLSNIGDAYENVNMLDSALFCQLKVLSNFVEINGPFKVLCLTRLGLIYKKLGNLPLSLKYFHEALHYANSIGDKLQDIAINNFIAELYKSENQKDSSLYYARLAFVSSRINSQKKQILIASNTLAKLFKLENRLDSVIYYQDIAIAMNDSLYGPEKLRQLQLLTLKQQEKQQEILQEQERNKNRIKLMALLASLCFFFVIAILLYRNNLKEKKAKAVIEKTLTQLKATQNQLIQSEKLASLGELTAGIAHEIQNPLNFVNNFAKLSVDLAKDINSEIHQSHIDKDYVEELLTSLSSNQEKISHHGNRAATIVKGMIEHSKPNTGKRELTDINKLCEEYSRLSFNGLKTKNPDLKVELITHFDESLPKIEIVPQDIGRVIVNLVNNAFYAVNERYNNSKNLVGFENLRDLVTISTQKTANTFEIRIKDNGMGMSENVKTKIFQPFFTTKPTGQGTGLGLSLAYDIITKGHGGTLTVESAEGEGSEFFIILPFQK